MAQEVLFKRIPFAVRGYYIALSNHVFECTYVCVFVYIYMYTYYVYVVSLTLNHK